MLAGHYAPAFVAAGSSRRAPLWMLLVAAQFVDVLWGLAILTDIEHGHLDASLPSNPLVLDDMPWTHSLAGTAVWSALGFAIARRAFGLATRDAALVASVVASHWFADLLVHRPDLTIAGSPPKLGLALWNHPMPALLLEIVLVVASIAYAASVRAGSASARRWVVLGGALVVLQLATAFGPTPPTITAIAGSGLVAYALVALAGAWVDAGDHA